MWAFKEDKDLHPPLPQGFLFHCTFPKRPQVGMGVLCLTWILFELAVVLK